MEWNLTTIGILLGVMFFGYFFGLFEGRSQGYKRRKKEEDVEKREKPQDETLENKPLGRPDEQNILNLWVDPSQTLHIDLDGHRIVTSSLTLEQRRRLIAILNQIRPWLDVSASPPTSEKTPPFRSTATQTAIIPEPTVPAQTPVRTEPFVVDDPTADSMVARIDKILQADLAGTPLADKGIRLQESPDGGVIVFVGLTHYSGIADIPDPAIQAAIRSAIAEWEKSATPGH